jgi:predicted nucleic acid-binding Zn ribbon protein
MSEVMTHCIVCGRQLDEYEQVCFRHTCDSCRTELKRKQGPKGGE